MTSLISSSESAGSEGHPHARPYTFVGRRRELTALARLVDGGGGKLRSAFIEGEAGIGKTRLLEETLGHASGRGIRVLKGYCYEVQEAGPYFPFLQILDQLRLAGSASQELLRSLATEALGAGNWAGLSGDVRGKRARFLRALSGAILREAASEETLLCIEDIQWADLGTLLVLNNLLDMGGAGPLILCTARIDGHTDAAARQLLARIDQKSRRIVLGGLTFAEAREYVDNLAGPGQVAEAEVRDMLSFTGGNPMFLRELFFHLQEAGLLDEHTFAGAIGRSRTPDRLAYVIDLRLRSLPANSSKTLSVCSALGTEFSAAVLAKLTEEPEERVEDVLEDAVSRGILKRGEDIDAFHYRFAHALFPMRLYDILSASQRRVLHRQISEAATCGSISLSASELARHLALGFGTAGGREAIRTCREAAEQAEGVLAYETATRYWELALRCTRPRARRTRAELFRRLGWALWAASKWAQATEAWRRAILEYESLRSWEEVGALALALADVLRWRQKLSESERWVTRALELPLRDQADRARALALLGDLRALRSEPAQALSLLEEAIEVWSNSGREPVVAYWLSLGYQAIGDHSTAHAVAKLGLDEAQRSGASNPAALLGASLVIHELSQLNLDSARSYALIVHEAIDSNDATTVARSLVSQAYLMAYQGSWRRVAKLCERWMAELRLAGGYQVATARFIRAEAQLALGDASAAQDEMLCALPNLEHMSPAAAVHLARAMIQLGENRQAASIVRRFSERLISSSHSAAGRTVLGEVASSLEMPDLWRRCYDFLKAETRPVVMVYSPISVRRVLGRLASRLKLWDEAIEHFESALQQLTKGGARWELALTYFDYAHMRCARRRRGDLRKAAALELEAETILQKLGIERAPLRPRLARSVGENRFGLTGRELEVLALVAKGRRNREIAGELTLSHRTVERHLESIFGKMGANGRTEAVIQAMQEGLVSHLASPPHSEGAENHPNQAAPTP